MCNGSVLLETEVDLPLAARGKVRDIYDLGQELLFVASDRISAFDCILGSGIPCKGRVLTQISLVLVRAASGPGSESCSDSRCNSVSVFAASAPERFRRPVDDRQKGGDDSG